jgi:protein involved in polysaccharide export with SLBB domain
MRKFFLLGLLLFGLGVVQGLAQDLLNRDISKVKVDQLTDDQIQRFIEEADRRGLSDQDIRQQAVFRGLPNSEAGKLIRRIREVRQKLRNGNQESAEKVETDSLSQANLDNLNQQQNKFTLTEEEQKVFGMQLFTNATINFEPSLNIPTPNNYQLGVNDELIINIWGASQQVYQQIVDREGMITIPNLGPIYVNGLTIEEARRRIINRLKNIYAGLERPNPNTYADITLGSVRSIKVTLIGEVRKPGTYTVPSLTSMFNVLYLSGGPTFRGSFRNIEIIRNNKVHTTFDMYDFLVKGSQDNNILLRDQDIIRISTYENRIEMVGEVKRPGYYEVQDRETLKDAFTFAGGFTENAYAKNFRVTRNTDQEKSIVDVSKEEKRDFQLKNGDIIEVGEILDRFSNRVEVVGAVYREGAYELEEGMTVGDLIRKAEGLREDAFTSRAILLRLKPNLSTSSIGVNLRSALSEATDTIKLQREDVLRVFSGLSFRDQLQIEVQGEVFAPGKYPYLEDVTLGDAIILAGGLKESASQQQVEVARRKRDINEVTDEIAEVFTFDVKENFSLSDNASNFELKPFDQVFVRILPSYQEQQQVKIAGEVKYPGTYVLSNRNERVSSLIERAGGLTQFAFLEGTKFIRKIQLTKEERKQQELQRQRLLEDTAQNREITTVKEQEQIGINLAEVLKNSGERNDFILQAGDSLYIPKELQTVKISGELLYPVTVRYEKNRSLSFYLSQAGGFTNDANRKRTYVVYANGSVDRTRSFIGIRNYPGIEPGAEIIVPAKPERKGITAQQAISISSALASLALVIITLVNNINIKQD